MNHPRFRHIVVQWPGFGPYHLARIAASHRLATDLGHRVTGLETAGGDRLYDWGVDTETRTRAGIRTVFPESVFESIAPSLMSEGIVTTLDDLDPDAVAITSYSFPDARACLEWCRSHRKSAILMSATKEDDAQRVWWREWIKRRIVSQYDAALVGGTAQSLYLQRLGMSSRVIFTGYNVVDNEFFSAGAQRERERVRSTLDLPGLTSDRPFFLANGRLIRRKNLPFLLEAFSHYHSASEDPWRLVIVGDGPARLGLEGYVAANGVPDVTLAGRRTYEELPSYYGRAGAFVHPATHDQWGLVVNEAMASELPVAVSTGAGCVHDLIIDGVTGLRFDPSDVGGLAKLLHTLDDDHELRSQLATAAKNHIDRFSVDTFARGLFRASDAAALHSNRRMGLVARVILFILRKTTRSTSSFHTVEA